MKRFFRKLRWRHGFLTLMYLAIFFVVISPFYYVYYINNGIPPLDRWIESQTIDHLEAAGISEDDIADRKVVRPYYATHKDYYKANVLVSFRDDPNVYYIYGKEKFFGEVVQFCEKEIVRPMGSEILLDEMEFSEDRCVALRPVDDTAVTQK